MSVQSKPVKLTPFGAALAGALGGCFSTAVVYPLDVAKTRIQALPKGKNKDEQSMFGVMLQIFQKEGIVGLYRGFGATMMNTFSMQYAYFFFYSMVRTSYMNRLVAKLPKGSKLPQIGTAMELILGALAGALAQIFTIPVSVIATRQQVGKTNSSFLGVAKGIVKEDGIPGLWLGIRPGLILTVNPAITYGMFERVKSIVVLAQGTDKLSPGLSFLVGALSKTLATVVTYPYIMAKVRIQARSSDEDSDELPTTNGPKQVHHPGALDILTRVWQREGFVGWYQGMQAQIIKAVLSQALLFMSKDQFEKYAFVLMIAYGKVTSLMHKTSV